MPYRQCASSLAVLSVLLLLGVGTLGIEPAGAQPPPEFEVPLIVQEILPLGGESPGDRTQEMVSVGIPLPEDSGVTFTGHLGMRGVSAAKFTALARWETGGLKWVLVDFLADVPSGGENRSITMTAGTGGFGGDFLTTDTPNRFIVDTGPAQFFVSKNGPNLFNRIVVDGVEVLSPSRRNGIVAYDFQGNPFSSLLDLERRVELVHDGPVKAVILVHGRHGNEEGQGFLDYTLRLEFARNSRTIGASYTMRNARYAANRHVRCRGIDLVLDLNLGPEVHYGFGTHTGSPATGTVDGEKEAYFYQAASTALWDGASDELFIPPIPRGPDGFSQTGYRIVRDGTTVQETDDPAHFPTPSYASARDDEGRGIGFGIRFLPRLWPGAYEVRGDGRVTVGLFTPRTGHHYTWNFGVHETREFFLSFHGTDDGPTGPAEARTRALAFRHPVKARVQDVEYFNECRVISDELVSVEDENRLYSTLGIPYTKQPENIRPVALRYYDAGQGGGGNQLDKSYHQFFEWMRTGLGGLYLDAELTALYRSDWATFHSDDWLANYVEDPRFAPPVGASNNGEFPTTRKHIFDNQHSHNRHQPIWYFHTGNRRYRDSFLDNMEGRVFSPKTRFENLRTTGTRIFARTSWLLMEAYRFVEDIHANNGFNFDRDWFPPLSRQEIREVGFEYTQWGMDRRYFRDGVGWSDEPMEEKNDPRRFWAGGANRLLYEEVIFHVANLFPDAIHNWLHLTRGVNDPLRLTLKQRLIDLNTFVWDENIYGKCLDDPTKRGNYYRYFTFDRGTGAVPPPYPECGEPTPDSGGYDNHPFYQLFVGAHKLTGDSVYLNRALNFLEGQVYNGGVIRNGGRTDFQSAVHRLVRAMDERVPPNPPRRLTLERVGEHRVEISWRQPGPAPDGERAHKYLVHRGSRLLGMVHELSFEDDFAPDGATVEYRVRAIDPWGLRSEPARLTVTTRPDVTRPKVYSVRLPDVSDRLEVLFTEPVDPITATDLESYDVRGGIAIHAARMGEDNPRLVILETDAHPFDRTFLLEVRNVRDLGSDRLVVAAGTEVEYRSLYHEENFDDGVADNFYPVSGRWEVVNGTYRKISGDWHSRSLFRARPFEDFTMEIDVRIPTVQTAWAGVTLDTKGLYTWRPYGGNLVLFSNEGSVGVHNEVDPDRDAYAGLMLPDPTGWHHLSITAVGDLVRVSLNGLLLVEWTDPQGSRRADWFNLHALVPEAEYDNLKIGPPILE